MIWASKSMQNEWSSQKRDFKSEPNLICSWGAHAETLIVISKKWMRRRSGAGSGAESGSCAVCPSVWTVVSFRFSIISEPYLYQLLGIDWKTCLVSLSWGVWRLPNLRAGSFEPQTPPSTMNTARHDTCSMDVSSWRCILFLELKTKKPWRW